MGQSPSRQRDRHLKGKLFSYFAWKSKTRNLYPQQPIKFQFKTKRSSGNIVEPESNSQINNVLKLNRINEEKAHSGIRPPARPKSAPNLLLEREKKKYRAKIRKLDSDWYSDIPQFGYEIEDVDTFLNKATIEKPANIPVVLAFPSLLYKTRVGGYQVEIELPLGMVVNAVFKNQHWLYVQTPHAEEGYVSYAACLPLGILPPPDDTTSTPCWERSTDVFPKPSGNMTDSEKLSTKSDCEGITKTRHKISRHASSVCEEKSIDRLYLRAAKTNAKTGKELYTLLVITSNFCGRGNDDILVKKGDVVYLLDASFKGWFYVKDKDGNEGYIPSAIAGHGFV
ncbi:unnamed protein product [Phyllotreta striolata]|uniref:SH3 domain-containing protein n=1 Tax=Phyllotreta striolata TaxID=444603 RepID=A0A9N9XLW1_PHYSR|nr:unnamed protein product [Phyllotreta striolata]